MSARSKNSFISRSHLLAAVSLLALISAPAHAYVAPPPSVTNWTGLGVDSTDWSDANNWDNGTPTTSTPGFFNTGTTVNVFVDSTQQPGALTVDNNTTVNLQADSILNDDMIVGDAGAGTFNNMSATHNVTGNLILGNQSSSSGTYTVTGNTASTSVNFAGDPSNNKPSQSPNGALIVGNKGTGNFTQGTDATDSGNQVTVAGDLAVGLQSGSTGTYTLNSGSLTVGGIVVVGEGSTNANTFNQYGGSVNITGNASSDARYAPVVATQYSGPGSLYVGAASTNDNGVGTYNMYGGSLSASNIVLGFGGVGTLNQSGGSVTTNNIDMGDCGGCNGGDSAGFYNLTGTGSLNAGGINVGDFGHGEFVQNGAGTTNTVSGTLSIGNGATAQPNLANPGNYDRSGTYTLNSGLLSTQNTVVGSAGQGTFNQNGGTHAVSNTLTVGQTYQTPSGPLGTGTPGNLVFGGPALGYYNMTGGALTANGDPTTNAGIIVGDAGTGTFTQTGGSVTSGLLNQQEGDLIIGNQGGAAAIPATPDLPGQPGTGTPEIPATTGSTGTYSLTDPNNTGTVSLTVNGNVEIGRSAGDPSTTPATGTFTMGSGTDSPTFTTNATGGANGDVTVGDAGIGFFTVKSGTANIAGILGAGVNGTGTITQSGGTINASYVDLSTPTGSGSSSYTMTGGTLNTTNDLNVGGGSTGIVSFTQSGASTQTNVGGTLRVGNTAGTASVALNGGALNVTGDSYVGVGSFSGSMSQSAGSHSVNGTLYVGDGTSTGTYTLTGGTLTTGITGGSTIGDVVVGNGGTGEIDNSGGQQISKSIDGFTLGWEGSGTYKLTGTGSLNVTSNENIGEFGTGTFIQGDGNGTTSNIVGGSLYMNGGYGGPTSTYTLKDGSLQVTGDEVVGFAATSTFTQSGGTNTVGGDLNLGLLASSSDPTQFGAGTFNLSGSGSTLSVTGNTVLGVNAGTTGSFTQTGGAFTTQNFTVGSGGTGTYTQSGGTAKVLGDMTIGSAGTATVTSLQAATITNNNKLILANASVTAPVVTNNGLLEGTGTITGNVTNSGTVHPGDSPGILNVVGDYIQQASGILDFTIAGTTPGTGYSQLKATGALNLAGTASITDTSFKLTNGDDFTFLTAGKSTSGSLSNVMFDSNLCSLSGGLYSCSGNGQSFAFQEIVSANAVDFKVEDIASVPLPASLPMLGATLAGLMGFALNRRRKAIVGE